MKKIVISVLVFVVLVAVTTISFAVTGKINTDNARLRSGASSDATVKDVLSINDKVEIIDESGDWYQIKAGDETGYVSKSLIDTEESATSTETNTTNTTNTTSEATNTTTNAEQTTTQENTSNTTNEVKLTESYVGTLNSEVTIKILPSINSTDIEKIEKDTQITIVEIINDWCHIETSELSGWARLDITKAAVSDNATSEQIEESTEEVTEETQTKVGYVNTETVNLRQEANTSSEKLDSLTKNTEVTIIGEEGEWYRVQVNGKTGYISKQYIADSKVEEVTSRAADTARQIMETQGTSEETTPAPASGSAGSDVVSYAMQFLGYNYVSGGKSPSTGFDCSGFTSYVYKQFGVSLSASSSGQRSNGVEVSKSDLQPGDIVCFSGHVGLYIGNNQFIHAANAKKGVIITSLSDSYYVSNYITARRVL